MSLFARLRLPPSPKPYLRPADLVYAANDRPPANALVGLAVQHAATALALIAYVLAISRMAHLSTAATSGMVTATVLGMAVSTLLQAWGGRLGAGALIIHMPDPIVIAVVASVLTLYGPGGLVVVGLANGLAGLVIGQVIPRLRAWFPPTVAGVVVALTGIELVVPALHHATGYAAEPGFEPDSLLIGGVTLAVIVSLSVWGSRRIKLFALLIGLLCGVLLAAALGKLGGGAALAQASFFGLPALAAPVFNVNPGLIAAAILLSVMVQLDTLGTVILMGKMDDADWRRPNMQQVSGGIRAGSLGNIIAGFLGGCPSATSSANIALSHISRSTSRYVGVAVAAVLALVAFLPKATVALTLIPEPVIGAVEIYAAAYLVVSGIELIASRALDARGTFMIGLSLLAGVSVMLIPSLPKHTPHAIRYLTENGVIVGGVVAIVLNLVFRLGLSQRATLVLPEDPARRAQAVVQFVEGQGAAWSARRDAVHRAATAVHEAVDAIAAAGQGRRVLEIRGSFDEFNLDFELRHSGAPLKLAGHAPVSATLLDTDDDTFMTQLDSALEGVSAVLLKRLADRITTGERGEQAYFRMHFAH